MNKPQIRVEQQSQVLSATNWLASMLEKGLQSGAIIVQLSRHKRSDEQNRHLWAILRDVANSCTWPTSGGRQLSQEQWKMLFMSAYREEVGSIVMGINGEPVNLNLGTSRLNKREFSELVEFIYATGTGWGVKWTDPAMLAYEELTK